VSFYLLKQKRKVDMESRFSPCETHPIDPTPQRMETSENIFQWDGRILLRMENE